MSCHTIPAPHVVLGPAHMPRHLNLAWPSLMPRAARGLLTGQWVVLCRTSARCLACWPLLSVTCQIFFVKIKLNNSAELSGQLSFNSA